MAFLVYWSSDHINIYQNLQERTVHHSDFFGFVWIQLLYTVLRFRGALYAFAVVV